MARRRWQVRAVRHRGGTVNQAAVAQVLAEWMWERGEACEADTLLPRRLKDRVSRALSGEYLPPQTLRIFIDAFDMTDSVAHQLWADHFEGQSCA